MKTSELDYELPQERIAQHGSSPRDDARLLVVDRASSGFGHRRFRDLPELLAPGDLLVRNVSRVIPARLHARRRSGGRVELLLLRESSADRWTALARPGGRLRHHEELVLDSGLVVRIERREGGEPGTITVFAPGLAAEIERSGLPPLPPYIRRPAHPHDRARYQTVYARDPGSVAAPTAGLHFTLELLARLAARGIGTADVVLHVGPGTFLPVRSERLEDHHIHAEAYAVPADTVARVQATLAAGGRVVAVGTTAVRALESAAAAPGGLSPAAGETRLFIYPGHSFRAIRAILTNFHQPRSTLLALVAAFVGAETLRRAYTEALAREYRFLSYGDAMLLL